MSLELSHRSFLKESFEPRLLKTIFGSTSPFLFGSKPHESIVTYQEDFGMSIISLYVHDTILYPDIEVKPGEFYITN
jgi:hypothetical protein